jgi:hypothetical protein
VNPPGPTETSLESTSSLQWTAVLLYYDNIASMILKVNEVTLPSVLIYGCDVYDAMDNIYGENYIFKEICIQLGVLVSRIILITSNGNYAHLAAYNSENLKRAIALGRCHLCLPTSLNSCVFYYY